MGAAMSQNKISRRGFTLVELIIAGIIAVVVVGTLGASLSQLARARASSKVRLNAHLRANTALEKIRRELQQVIRSDNLIDTRILLTGDSVDSPIGELPRNDVLIYSTKLSPVRNKTYEGDGIEHEVQLRVSDDESGSALWMRSDAVPDDNEGGGGKAAPIMDGIIGLYIEASDGTDWYDSWDSDINGLPVALRVTVSSAGDAQGADFFADSRELMSLRTIVPIDRVPPPYEEPPAEDPASAAGGEVAAAAAAAGATQAEVDAAIAGAGAAGIAGTQGTDGVSGGGGRGGRGGQGGQGGQTGGRGGQGGQGGGFGGNRPANQGTGGRPN